MKLFLKGDRCFTVKCAVEKRNYPPGEHGQRRSKPSEYGLQLAREAEDEADLRRPGGAVPHLLRDGRAAEGGHRREPGPPPRAATGQRRAPSRVRGLPRPGAGAGPARALPRERAAGDHSVRPAQGRRRGRGPAQEPRADRNRRRPRGGEEAPRARLARVGRRQLQGRRSGPFPARKRWPSRFRSNWWLPCIRSRRRGRG